jgi:hypothetical protein
MLGGVREGDREESPYSISGNFAHELLERGKLDLDHIDGRLVLE